MRTERIAIRITPDLKRALEDLAHDDHRTLSNYLEMILSKHAEEKNPE